MIVSARRVLVRLSSAWIDDTNVKVIEVALDQIAHGLSPEEICDQHNGYLSIAQIHAALMHYYDNQAQFDTDIAHQLADYKQRRAQSLDSPGRRRTSAGQKRPTP